MAQPVPIVPQPIPITQQIEQNWQQSRNDPDTLAAIAKLDQNCFESDFRAMQESATTYLNFEAYKLALQTRKTRQSGLLPETETFLADRLDQARIAYQSYVSSANHLAQSLVSSGFETVLSRYSKQLCWQLPLNPRAVQLTQMLRNVGVNDAEISQYSASLKSNDWDLLRLNGGDGTFSGVVRGASGQVQTLTNMLTAVRLHGLPVIEGNANNPATWVTVGIVVAGVTCVFIGWCVFVV